MKVPSLVQRVWPRIVLILGLMVTVAWTAFLGFEFAELVEKAIWHSSSA
jgi:hypothetical protein